jgi:outer membrane receptor protein involved in Fe transport
MRKLILLLLFMLAASLFAATTGKIVGRVYDSSTGEALPGVNVIVEGTTMGAATDPDGYFVILNVPPGTYNVTARMMGYRDVMQTEVRVEADLTKTLEFPLESEAIAVRGVTVRAKRPIIKKDVTTSVAIISAEDMESTPVSTIEGVVSRQAGIIADGPYQYVRGGRDTEIVYVVDGVEMVDPFLGGFDSHVPQESVEETAVYTGGFGAEYGSAQSGVVNVITKSGGSDFHFTLKARTNDAFGIGGLQDFIDDNKSSDTTYLTVRTSDVATPYMDITGGDTTYYEEDFDKVTYTERGSGNERTIYVNDTLTADDWRPEKMKRVDFTLSGPIVGKTLRFFLGGEYWKDEGFHGNYDNAEQTYTGKLTFKPTQAFKIDLHGLYHYNDRKAYSVQWKFFLDRYYGKLEDLSYSYGIDFTHAINPRIYHELRFNNYTTSFNSNIFEDGSYDMNGDGVIDDDDIDGIDDFTDEDNDRWVEINGVERINPETGEGFDWPELIYWPFTAARNYNNFYYQGYYRIAWTYDKHETWTGKWDLTAQIGRAHELKMGLSGKYYELFRYRADMASGGNVYMDWTKAYPYRLSAYLQDKLEQESFVLNAGIRFDFFSPNSDNLPGDIYNPVLDPSEGGEVLNPMEAEDSWAISPRVGFSFPITEYDKFHFTYGHYFQVAPLLHLYRNINYDFSGAFPMVGNPNLEPEKTVGYEFGIQHAFNDEVLIDVTTYMRDITGLTDTEQIFYTAGDYYTRYRNSDYGSARGFEIKFSKRRGGTPAWLVWDMIYTFGVARGKSSSTRQNYDFIWAGYVVPAEEHYLDWDQRHTLRADIGLHAPEGEALFGIPGFDNFGVNFTVNYGSGLPYSPPSSTKEQLINTERLPYTVQTDMRFYKDFEVGQLKLGLFGDIYHLFNRENINRYYVGWSDGSSTINYENWYHVYGDPAGPWGDPRVYDAKRYMRFGISVKW